MSDTWMRLAMNWVVGILAAIVTGFFTLFIAIYRKHTEKIDANETRISALEAGRVTHTQLEGAMSQMRTERRDMHEQNQAALLRIESKQDANKDIISEIRMDVAVLTSRLPVLPTPKPRGRK